MPLDHVFVPMTRADHLLFADWLSQPHIDGWWGNAQTELALVEEDMAHGPTDMRMVTLNGHSLAYIQDYPAHHWPAHHWPAPHFADQPRDARAIETFPGDPDYLGQGHAKTCICQRAAQLVQQRTVVLTDPDPHNMRALATYSAAGSIALDTRHCEDGDRVVVMQLCCLTPFILQDKPHGGVGV